MAEQHIKRADAAVPQACARVVPTCANSLPIELLTEILGYLRLNCHLWPAAAVSRIFYAAAWHAGLFIERQIFWSDTVSYVPKLAIFNEVVQHAVRNAPHVRLGFSFRAYPGAWHVSRARPAYYDSLLPDMQRVLGAVTAALPVLVRLSIDLNVHFTDQLAHALGYAAPHLEDLEFKLHAVSDRNVSTVPSDLFAGAAPRLRTVTLRDAYLGSSPVAAFSGVTELSLAYCNSFPETALAPHFPRLSDLTLQFFFDSAWAEPPDRLGLDGLRLRRLCVQDEENIPLMPAVAASTDLRAIPDLEHAGDAVEYMPAPWTSTDALAVRISWVGSDAYGTCMRVSPANPPRRWRRTHVARDWRRDTLALPDGMVTRLQLDSTYLPRLLDTPQLRLGTLIELHVDLCAELSVPDTTAAAVPRPGCTNLQTLRLCARDMIPAVDAGAVASLGRALHLSPRRAVLVLSGVELAGVSALLDETFSFVRTMGHECRENDEDGYSWH